LWSVAEWACFTGTLSSRQTFVGHSNVQYFIRQFTFGGTQCDTYEVKIGQNITIVLIEIQIISVSLAYLQRRDASSTSF
jgi:hypothetical protein